MKISANKISPNKNEVGSEPSPHALISILEFSVFTFYVKYLFFSASSYKIEIWTSAFIYFESFGKILFYVYLAVRFIENYLTVHPEKFQRIPVKNVPQTT